MAGGEPRFGTTATYMRRHDHRASCLSIEIDRLHDRLYNEYQVFSAASVRKWSKFGLKLPPRLCRRPRCSADLQGSAPANSDTQVPENARIGEVRLATIVFAVLVLDEKLPGNDTIMLAAGWTVLLSVIAHGVTANPLVKRMAGRSLAETEEGARATKLG